MSGATLGGLFTFPRTSLTVHRVGYGAMQLAGSGVWGPPKDPEGAVAPKCVGHWPLVCTSVIDSTAKRASASPIWTVYCAAASKPTKSREDPNAFSTG